MVLPINALEHKAPMSEFARNYPKASVWVTLVQYGPFGSCGMDARRDCKMGYRADSALPIGGLGESTGMSRPPWADKLYAATLYVSLPENAGSVSGSTSFHKLTRSMITVDLVVYVTDATPPIFGTYFNKRTVSNPDFWPKSVLQAIFPPLRQGGGSSLDMR